MSDTETKIVARRYSKPEIAAAARAYQRAVKRWSAASNAHSKAVRTAGDREATAREYSDAVTGMWEQKKLLAKAITNCWGQAPPHFMVDGVVYASVGDSWHPNNLKVIDLAAVPDYTPKPKRTKPHTHRIGCPDCGEVDCIVEGYDDGRPVCGKCPKCGDTLYFA